MIDEAQGGLRSELDQLESAREQLRTDIATLEKHLERERTNLRMKLTEALNLVGAAMPSPTPAPGTSNVEVPPLRWPTVTEPPVDGPDLLELDEAAGADAALVAESGAEPEPEPEAEVELEGEIEPELETSNADVPEPAPAAMSAEPGFAAAVPPPPPPPPAHDDPEWSPFAPAASGVPEPAVAADAASAEPVAAPPEMAPARERVPVASAAASDDFGDSDDPFIAELRRAITDDEPLGPRDDDAERSDLEDGALHHSDVLDGSRLGSLLRRKR